MPIAKKPHAALLITGHGSTENPDSSTPYFEHADAIRQRGIFSEVHCCFWKEEPSMREALYMIDAPEVYIVPDFISEGYFTQDVIPREFRLTGPTTERAGKTLHYTLPVGVHPSMTSLILKRAREIAPEADPAETTLIITGHGTGLNQNSTKAIRDQVALIAASGAGFAHVTDAYMEEAPFITNWDKLAPTGTVIVVPFFIADGLHSYQDIPVLLGIESDPGQVASQRGIFRSNPHKLRGKTLYYSSAIGTESSMADVILDQIADYDRQHQSAAGSEKPPAYFPVTGNAAALAEMLAVGFRRIGELAISDDPETGGWLLHHHLDFPGDPSLEGHIGPAAARDVSTFAPDGSYRFNKARRNLTRGWLLRLASENELLEALDLIYPAAIGLHRANLSGSIEIQNLREKLSRQTGMYIGAKTITTTGAQHLIARTCGPENACARKILWQIDSETPLEENAATLYDGMPEGGTKDSIPLLCREACNYFVAECRAAAKAERLASKSAG